MKVEGIKQFIATLEFIQELKKCQVAAVEELDMDRLHFTEEQEALVLSMLQLTKDVRSVRIRKCHLTASIWQHLVEQVEDSSKLEKLNLNYTKGGKNMTELKFNTLKSLAEVRMYRCCMAPDVSLAVLANLSQCRHLVTLDLRDNTLTNCMNNLVGTGFPNLEGLFLSRTKLSKTDLMDLSEAVVSSKIPKLRNLNVSENVLTDWISDVSGLRKLELLNLRGTQLSKSSIKALSDAALHGQLPKLKTLFLSDNVLTGCIQDLFGGSDHPGFGSINVLCLGNVGLAAEDVVSLTDAIQRGKLPNLNQISLLDNNTNDMQQEIRVLVRSCLMQYKHGEFILFLGNKLSREFRETLMSLFRGSNITVC